MWKVVYIASNKEKAESLSSRLEAEGFLVRLGADETLEDGRTTAQIELLVLESEAEEALELLQTYLGQG